MEGKQELEEFMLLGLHVLDDLLYEGFDTLHHLDSTDKERVFHQAGSSPRTAWSREDRRQKVLLPSSVLCSTSLGRSSSFQVPHVHLRRFYTLNPLARRRLSSSPLQYPTLIPK